MLQGFKRSLYERCFNADGIFVAFFCTFSNVSISPLLYGARTEEQIRTIIQMRPRHIVCVPMRDVDGHIDSYG